MKKGRPVSTREDSVKGPNNSGRKQCYKTLMIQLQEYGRLTGVYSTTPAAPLLHTYQGRFLFLFFHRVKLNTLAYLPSKPKSEKNNCCQWFIKMLAKDPKTSYNCGNTAATPMKLRFYAQPWRLFCASISGMCTCV